jgi:hypothetical protein
MASSNLATADTAHIAGSTPQRNAFTSFDEFFCCIEREERTFKSRYPMFCFSDNQFARIQRAIDQIVGSSQPLPNGKGRRSTLTSKEVKQLKLDLFMAAGFAARLVVKGALKNRIFGRGRPPDNTTFIFIDDLMQACQAVGLKPGLRFVSGSQSLPVRLYIALAPILGFGVPKNPRRLFQRWKSFRNNLVRSGPPGISEPSLFCLQKPRKVSGSGGLAPPTLSHNKIKP